MPSVTNLLMFWAAIFLLSLCGIYGVPHDGLPVDQPLPQFAMSDSRSREASVNQAFDDARVFFLSYAKGAAPADLYDRMQWTMSSIHLEIVEAYQNIYKRADGVQPNEEQAFAKYCYFAHQALDHHHWFEETMAFPMLEPEFKCDAVAEHAAFEEAMGRWQEYLLSVLEWSKDSQGKTSVNVHATKAPYDAAKMKKCMEDLSGPLLVHLHHEIEWLAPEKLRACGLPLSKLQAVEATSARVFSREIDLFSLGYFMMSHSPPGCEFPTAPWFVKRIIVPYVLYWKHRDAWRFVPDFSSRKQAIRDL